MIDLIRNEAKKVFQQQPKAEQFSPKFHKLKDKNPIVKQIFFEVLVLLDFSIDFEKNVLSEFNRVQKCIQSFPNRK